MIGVVLVGSAWGLEKRGATYNEDVAENVMEFVTRLKDEFAKRAAMVEAQTGNKIELGYRYYHPPLTKEQEQNQRSFLLGRTNDRISKAHITNFSRDLEQARQRLAAAEEKASVEWEEENADGFTGRVDSAEVRADIFGLEVVATNLGVILDNSPSMREFLPALREEITSNFTESYFIEVRGSWVNSKADAPWFFAAPMEEDNPFDPKWWIPEVPSMNFESTFRRWNRDNPSAIVALIELMKVDAIYWFCDFDDEEEDEAVARIAGPILENGVALYVHTVKNRPSKALEKLIEDSGGELIRKRM